MRQHWRFWTFITIVVLAGVILVPAFLHQQQQAEELRDMMNVSNYQYEQLVQEGLIQP